MSDEDVLQSYYDYVLPLVLEAGKEILEAKNYVVEYKEDISDVVTEYDKKVEKVLINKIKRRYPEHKFIGEEESAEKHDISILTNDPTWIIDPIDGTLNFVRKFPITCISIGFTIQKELVLGVVYNPFMDELYTAMKGKGAFLNGNKIETSRLKDIRKSVMNYELSLAKKESLKDMYLYRFSKLVEILSGVRSYGSAALGLCYVANGSTDAYQVDGLYPWDAAAGVLILREAGGYVCDSSGEDFDLMNPNFIAAATQELAEDIMKVEREADQERTRS